jgi:hypothetical protein
MDIEAPAAEAPQRVSVNIVYVTAGQVISTAPRKREFSAVLWPRYSRQSEFQWG